MGSTSGLSDYSGNGRRDVCPDRGGGPTTVVRGARMLDVVTGQMVPNAVIVIEAISLFKQHGTYLVPTTYRIDRINLAVLRPLVRAKAESIMPLLATEACGDRCLP